MQFADFQRLRETILRERPDVHDCAATNLYAALAHLIPPGTLEPGKTVHRCHLASEWCERFGFAPDVSRRALISCGVRHSLSLLFSYYAGENARVWLPEDNYPVYGELARAAGLTPSKFPTLPEPEWPKETPASSPELLVLTNPLKPRGRWLTAADVEALATWLDKSPRRRLVLDAVYTFDTQFHPTTLQLLETGQATLLHSLTKGWLQPRLFGIALVPERDSLALTEVFRAQPPPQANLARARELMAQHAGMPRTVANNIALARERLVDMLPVHFPDLAFGDAPGYLAPVEARWSDLLDHSNILCLPASVFGSQREDLTILSSLSFLP